MTKEQLAERLNGRNGDDMIQVCDNCHRACCWQGEFMCQQSTNAGTIHMPRKALMVLDLEHPDYLKTDEELANE